MSVAIFITVLTAPIHPSNLLALCYSVFVSLVHHYQLLRYQGIRQHICNRPKDQSTSPTMKVQAKARNIIRNVGQCKSKIDCLAVKWSAVSVSPIHDSLMQKPYESFRWQDAVFSHFCPPAATSPSSFYALINLGHLQHVWSVIGSWRGVSASLKIGATEKDR